jgi:hypothetical protein
VTNGFTGGLQHRPSGDYGVVSGVGTFDVSAAEDMVRFDSTTAGIDRHIKLLDALKRLYLEGVEFPFTLGDDPNFEASARELSEEFRENYRRRLSVLGINWSSEEADGVGYKERPVSIVEMTSEVDRQIRFTEGLLDTELRRAYTMNPRGTFALYGETQERVLKLYEDSLAKFAAATDDVTFKFVPMGAVFDVYTLDPSSGVTKIGTIPREVAGRVIQWEVRQETTSGDLIAFDPGNPANRHVIAKDFAFPEIDPQIKFATEVEQFAETLDLAEQRIFADFQGLELERRGQMIEALGQDLARQISIGRMTFEAATLKLQTIDTAFSQRRAEREQALQFAVRKSSLRAGGTETLLPGGKQLEALLAQATGQDFTGFATLPAGKIDPDATAQAVVQAAAFDDPVPGLTGALGATREAINAIVGVPIGTELVTDGATKKIVEGI